MLTRLYIDAATELVARSWPDAAMREALPVDPETSEIREEQPDW